MAILIHTTKSVKKANGSYDGWYIARFLQNRKAQFIIGLVMIIILCIAVSSVYTQLMFREYDIKAAYLYNFAKFVEWPSEVFDDASSPLILCILGKEPFNDSLDTIKGKTIRERELVIKRFTRVEDINECHILFISTSEEKHLSRIFKKINDMHILTVADLEGFAHRGGMINLITVGNKVHFEINVDAAQRAELQISSKLLKLAKIVKEQN